jgi:hypothetical protein
MRWVGFKACMSWVRICYDAFCFALKIPFSRAESAHLPAIQVLAVVRNPRMTQKLAILSEDDFSFFSKLRATRSNVSTVIKNSKKRKEGVEEVFQSLRPVHSPFQSNPSRQRSPFEGAALAREKSEICCFGVNSCWSSANDDIPRPFCGPEEVRTSLGGTSGPRICRIFAIWLRVPGWTSDGDAEAG